MVAASQDSGQTGTSAAASDGSSSENSEATDTPPVKVADNNGQRLLKSWATPPVSCPMPSIFCACVRRSAAARRSVKSRVTLANPTISPPASRMALITTLAQNGGLLCASASPRLRISRSPLRSRAPCPGHPCCGLPRYRIGKMLPDDLFSGVTLDALRAGIPVDHVAGRIEHEDGVVG